MNKQEISYIADGIRVFGLLRIAVSVFIRYWRIGSTKKLWEQF